MADNYNYDGGSTRTLGKYKYILKKENVVKVSGKDSVRAGLKLVQGSVAGDKKYTVQQRYVENKLVSEMAFDDWDAAARDADLWIEQSYDTDMATKLEKADADLYAKVKEARDYAAKSVNDLGRSLSAATNIAVGGDDVNAALASLGSTPAGEKLAEVVKKVAADGSISVAEMTSLFFAIIKYATATDAAQATNAQKAAAEIEALRVSLRATGQGVSNLVAQARILARRTGLDVPSDFKDQVKAGWIKIGKASIDLDALLFNLIVLRGTSVTTNRPEAMLDAVLGNVEAAKPICHLKINADQGSFRGKTLQFSGIGIGESGSITIVSDGSAPVLVPETTATLFEFHQRELHLVPTIGGIGLAGLYKYVRGEYADSYLPQIGAALSESIKNFAGFSNSLPNFGK